MIKESLQLGEPVEHRGVVICPVFPRRTPVAAYVTLEEALPRGSRVTEIDEAGAVPELNVTNPLEENVLLYDGEELLGAKQNRILNVTVLVRRRARAEVSCVEQGRWSRRSATFAAAPHAAYPELRRMKAAALSTDPLVPGRAQREVWESVGITDDLHAVHSATRAQADIIRSCSTATCSTRSSTSGRSRCTAASSKRSSPPWPRRAEAGGRRSRSARTCGS
jgi:hypothetical protein